MKPYVRTALIVLAVPIVAFALLWTGLYFTQGRHPTSTYEPPLTFSTCDPGGLHCVDVYGTPGGRPRGQTEVSVRGLAAKLGCRTKPTDEPFTIGSGECSIGSGTVDINVFGVAADRRTWLENPQDHRRRAVVVVGAYWTVTADSCRTAKDVQATLGGRLIGC